MDIDDVKRYFRERMTPTNIGISIALVVLIAGVVIYALNPAKQLAKIRNDQRRADAMLILDAVYQYTADNNGFPVQLPAAPTEICGQGGNCAEKIDLSVLLGGKKYLSSIPHDPKNTSKDGTGYQISKSVNGRITVSVIKPEAGVVVTVTR